MDGGEITFGMEKPPVIVEPKKRGSSRWAWTLNLLIPGAGQLFLGQIALGTILCVIFVVDFLAMLGVFLSDFARFLDLVGNGKILEGDNIEKTAKVYHVPLLLTFLGIGIIVYIISFVALARSEKTPKLDRPS